MSSMDKLPHNSNSLTSTSTTATNTTHTHWDLGMASMDTETRHHHILHSHQNEVVFPFSSIPTWQNYSPLPPPPPSSSSFSVQVETLVEENGKEEEEEEDEEELGAMKEMMYKIAAMQPVEIDPATIRRPKRRNVRISDDPQSVAARLRRERISEKIRILQCLVPGGTKLDTASMLEEAVRYVKFLKRQIRRLQHPQPPPPAATTAAREFEGEVPLCFSFNEG